MIGRLQTVSRDRIGRPGTGAVVVILLLSAVLHFFWLSYPSKVIFDEFHFGRFVNAYCCSHERIFDVHPPHAKLLIASGARALGYRGEMDYRAIDAPFGDVSPFPVRFVPALAGTLLPLIAYVLVLQLGGSRSGALFAALLLLLDNALIVQTRIIALDSILLVATLLSLVAILAALRARSYLGRSAYCFIAGVMAALAVGAKFTGLVAAGLVGTCVVVEMYRHRGEPRVLIYWLRKSLWIMAGFVMTYGLGWKLHFMLLTMPGPGDAWGLPSGDFLLDVISIHGKMLTANIGLAAAHPDSSSWWGWPLMHEPIFYWVHQPARLYFIGNPVIWWSAAVMLLVACVHLVLVRAGEPKIDAARKRTPVLWLPLLGFVGAYAPLSQVNRILFLYHYLTAFVFSILFVVLWLDRVAWLRDAGPTEQRPSVYAYLVLVVLGFVSISPVTYAFDTGAWVVDYLFAMIPGWR